MQAHFKMETRLYWMAKLYVLMGSGKPQFRDLLFHRGTPCFFAFDLLLDGKDWRSERLIDRKQELRRLLKSGKMG